MKKLIYFISGLLFVLGGLYLVSRQESPAPPAPFPIADGPVHAPFEIDETLPDFSEEVAEDKPDEMPPIAIEGRVVGPDFRPVGDVRLVFGEEEATTGEQGKFRFEPRVRPRTASLSCELDGQSVATWDVVVGSTTGETSRFESAPARLEWIRWTVGLFRPSDLTDDLWIHADLVLVEEWGNGGRVQVLGRTNLPDGAHIAGSVYFDNMRSFSSFDQGEVTEGEFRVVLWRVTGHRFFSGKYALKLTFNELFERPSLVDDWKRDRPGISTWSLTAEQSFFLGDEEQAQGEDRAAQAYYIEVRSAIEVLKAMLITRVREVQSLGRRWDPQLLKDRVAAKAGWFHQEMVTEDGKLAEDVWRDFLDGRWRPEVQKRLDHHRARGPQKYQEAEGRVLSLLGDLLRESFVYSRFVIYPIFNLPRHPNDFYQDESESRDLDLLDLKFKKNLSGLERFCRLVEDAEIRRLRSGDGDGD